MKKLLLLLLIPTFAIISGKTQLKDDLEKENPGAKNKNSRPNILVFIADDASMDYGCYGNDVIRTPNIDSLARNGLKVENAFLTTSQCSPSRTSLLTGQFAHTVGTEDLHRTQMSDTVKTLPGELKKAGYYTGVMLKEHFGSHIGKDFDWHDQGFRPDYLEGRWFDNALGYFKDFLDQTGDRPFFMWVGFVDPHRPYGPRDNIKDNRAAEVHDPDDIQDVPPYLVDNENTRIDLARYYDEIHRLDGQIGQFCREIRNRGLDQNTLVVFLSDNGYPFPRGKGTVYDAGIQTPLIFSRPGQIKKGTVHNNGLISTVDLMPTLLDAAGIDRSPGLYGQSFKDIFTDPNTRGREMIFAERNWHGTDEHIRCVRTEKYKLIRTAYTEKPLGMGSDISTSPAWYSLLENKMNNNLTAAQSLIFQAPRPGIELYDIRKDPYEVNNLALKEGYTEIIKELLNELEKWQQETRDHDPNIRKIPDAVDRVSGQPMYIQRRNEYYNDKQ
jgi:N-sulfoglucosamine sulfohydrolase